MSNEILTIVITRVLRPGAEDTFEQAVRDWIPKAIQFPGHLGVLMLRPAPGGREYGAVLRFRSMPEWEAFRDAPEYRAFLDYIQPLLEREPDVKTITGLEAWFAPFGTTMVHVPPRWKLALLTLLGVSVTGFVLRFTLLPVLADWHWLLGFFTFNMVMVACLTWLVMPTLGRLAHSWLHPRETRGDNNGTHHSA